MGNSEFAPKLIPVVHDSERAEKIVAQISDDGDREFLRRYIARLERRSDSLLRDEYPDTTGGMRYCS